MSRPFEKASVDAAQDVLGLAEAKKLTLITAESCTCGLLASLLSEAKGASELLHGGFVTYTKANKTAALGVKDELLRGKGAVCEEVARAIAEGALQRSPADVAVAITGVAGPEPDDDGNPVGLMFIAVARHGFATRVVEKNYRDTGRDEVRECVMRDALAELRRMMER